MWLHGGSAGLVCLRPGFNMGHNNIYIIIIVMVGKIQKKKTRRLRLNKTKTRKKREANRHPLRGVGDMTQDMELSHASGGRAMGLRIVTQHKRDSQGLPWAKASHILATTLGQTKNIFGQETFHSHGATVLWFTKRETEAWRDFKTFHGPRHTLVPPLVLDVL